MEWSQRPTEAEMFVMESEWQIHSEGAGFGGLGWACQAGTKGRDKHGAFERDQKQMQREDRQKPRAEMEWLCLRCRDKYGDPAGLPWQSNQEILLSAGECRCKAGQREERSGGKRRSEERGEEERGGDGHLGLGSRGSACSMVPF